MDEDLQAAANAAKRAHEKMFQEHDDQRTPEQKAHDALLQELLGKLTNLMNQPDSTDETLRQFILQYLDVPEFESLATTLVMLKKACKNGPLARKKRQEQNPN